MSWTHERGRVAALTRHRDPEDPAIGEARRDLRAARAEDYIRRVVDEAPPLTEDQRRRLAAILQGSTSCFNPCRIRGAPRQLPGFRACDLRFCGA